MLFSLENCFFKACFMQSAPIEPRVPCPGVVLYTKEAVIEMPIKYSLFCAKAVVCWESTYRDGFFRRQGQFPTVGCIQSADHTLVKWRESTLTSHEAEHFVWSVLWFYCLACFAFLVEKSFCQWNPCSSIASSVQSVDWISFTNCQKSFCWAVSKNLQWSQMGLVQAVCLLLAALW